MEIGIDKPKDIDLILKVIKPNIQIITGITLNHVEFGFESEADIWNEKKKLLYALNQNGTAVLNADDKYVCSQLSSIPEFRKPIYFLPVGFDFKYFDIEKHFPPIHRKPGKF